MKLTKTEIKAAVDRFREVTVKHRLQEATLETVLFFLELSPNCDIVNLVGPTGVGKSALQKRVVDAVHSDEYKAMLADSNFVPVIRTNALAAGYRLFDWKTLYRGALHELGDPFAMTRKALPGATVPQPKVAFGSESNTAAQLRLYLQEEFRKRRTKIWIIDEAQHIVFGGKSGEAGDQFDVLKSIAQDSGVKLLLAGPQELEAGLVSSGQLARRSITIHFPRYKHSDAEDMKTFASATHTFFADMQVAGYPSIKENAQFLYAGSAGCIGILKDWLAKAYGLALKGQKVDTPAIVTLQHLRDTRLSIDSMKTIMEDIYRGELSQKKSAKDDDYLSLVTGPPKVADAPENLGAAPNGNSKKSSKKGERSRNKRIGIRSPHARDQVPADTDAGSNAEACPSEKEVEVTT